MPYDAATQLAEALQRYRAGDLTEAQYNAIRDSLTRPDAGTVSPLELITGAISPSLGRAMAERRFEAQEQFGRAKEFLGEAFQPVGEAIGPAWQIAKALPPLRGAIVGGKAALPYAAEALEPYGEMFEEGSIPFAAPAQRMMEAQERGMGWLDQMLAMGVVAPIEAAGRLTSNIPDVLMKMPQLGVQARFPQFQREQAGREMKEIMLEAAPGDPRSLQPLAPVLEEGGVPHTPAVIAQEILNVFNLTPAEAASLVRMGLRGGAKALGKKVAFKGHKMRTLERQAAYAALPDNPLGTPELDALRSGDNAYVAYKKDIPGDSPLFRQLESDGFEFIKAGNTSTYGPRQVRIVYDPLSVNAAKARWQQLRQMGGKNAEETMRRAVVHGEDKLALLRTQKPESLGVGPIYAAHLKVGGKRIPKSTRVVFPGEVNKSQTEMYQWAQAAKQGDEATLAKFGLDEFPEGEVTIGTADPRGVMMEDAVLDRDLINRTMDELAQVGVPDPAARRSVMGASVGQTEAATRVAMWHTRGELPSPEVSRRLMDLRAGNVEKLTEYGLTGPRAQVLYDRAISGQSFKVPPLEKPGVISKRLVKEAEGQAVSAVERARDAAQRTSGEVSERLQSLGVPKAHADEATRLVTRGRMSVAQIKARAQAFRARHAKPPKVETGALTSQRRSIEARYGPELRLLEAEAKGLQDKLDLLSEAGTKVEGDFVDALAAAHYGQEIPPEAIARRKTGIPERSLAEYQLAENIAKRKSLATKREAELKAISAGEGTPILDTDTQMLGTLESLNTSLEGIERSFIEDLGKTGIVPDASRTSFRKLRAGNAMGAIALARDKAARIARAKAKTITGGKRGQAKVLEEELAKLKKAHDAIENEGNIAKRKLINDALHGIEMARRPQTALMMAKAPRRVPGAPPRHMPGAPPVSGIGRHTGLADSATLMDHQLAAGRHVPPKGVKGTGPKGELTRHDMPSTGRIADHDAVNLDIVPADIVQFEHSAGAGIRAMGQRAAEGIRPVHWLVESVMNPVKGIVGGVGAQGRKVSNLIHRKVFERRVMAEKWSKHYAAMAEDILPDPTDRLYAARVRELQLDKVPEEWLTALEAGKRPDVRQWIDEMAALSDEVFAYMGLPPGKHNDFYIPMIFDPKARANFLWEKMVEARNSYREKKPFVGPDGVPVRIGNKKQLEGVIQRLEKEHRLHKIPGVGYAEDVMEKRKKNIAVEWMHEKRRFGDMQDLRMAHPDDIMGHYIASSTRTKFLQDVNPLIESLAANVRGPSVEAVKSQLLSVRDLLIGAGGPMGEDRLLYKMIRAGKIIPPKILAKNPEMVGRFSAALRHATFAKYLTANPSSILVNATQGPFNNISAMGARWYGEGMANFFKNVGKTSEEWRWMEEAGIFMDFGKRWKLGQMDREILGDIIKNAKSQGNFGLYELAAIPWGKGENFNKATTMFTGTTKAKALLKEYKRLRGEAMRKGVRSVREIDTYAWEKLSKDFKDGTILYRDDEVLTHGRELQKRLAAEPELTRLPGADPTEALMAQREALARGTGVDISVLSRAAEIPEESLFTEAGRGARRRVRALGEQSLDPLGDLRKAVEGGLVGEKEFIKKTGLDAVNQLQFVYDKINIPSAAHSSALVRTALQFQDFVRMEFDFMFHTLGNPLASVDNFARWTKLLGMIGAVGGPFALPFMMDFARFSPEFRENLNKWDKARIKIGDSEVGTSLGMTFGRNLAPRVAMSVGQEYKFEKEGKLGQLAETFPAVSLIDELVQPLLIAGEAQETVGANAGLIEQNLRGMTDVEKRGMRATFRADSAPGKAALAIKPIVDPITKALGPAVHGAMGIRKTGDFVTTPGERIAGGFPGPGAVMMRRGMQEMQAAPGAHPGRAGRRGYNMPPGIVGDVSKGLGYMAFGGRPSDTAMLERQRRENEAAAATKHGGILAGLDYINSGMKPEMAAAKVSRGPGAPHIDADTLVNAWMKSNIPAHISRMSSYSGEEKYANLEENMITFRGDLTRAQRDAEQSGEPADEMYAQGILVEMQKYIRSAFNSQYNKMAQAHPGWVPSQFQEATEALDDELIKAAKTTGDRDFWIAVMGEYTSDGAWLNRQSGQWHGSAWRNSLANVVNQALEEGGDPEEAVGRWVKQQKQSVRERRRLFAQMYMATRGHEASRLTTDFGPAAF